MRAKVDCLVDVWRACSFTTRAFPFPTFARVGISRSFISCPSTDDFTSNSYLWVVTQHRVNFLSLTVLSRLLSTKRKIHIQCIFDGDSKYFKVIRKVDVKFFTSVGQRKHLSPRRESNPWPSVHRSSALTTELLGDSWRGHNYWVSFWHASCIPLGSTMSKAPCVPRSWQSEHSIFLLSFELKIYYLCFLITI